VKAYILIQAQPRADTGWLARQIACVPGVSSAIVVTGPYDVIVEIREDSAPMSNLVRRIIALNGVLHALPSPVVVAARVA
jgi:hypothetical protein